MIDPPIALILAGGAGTRFWPASRARRPKQLLPLLGRDPLLLETVRRVLPLTGMDRVLVASGRHLAEPTAAVLPELPPANLLVEPVARNTAPCIAWAVRAMMGMWSPVAFSRSRIAAVAANPLTSGICTSIRTR